MLRVWSSRLDILGLDVLGLRLRVWSSGQDVLGLDVLGLRLSL